MSTTLNEDGEEVVSKRSRTDDSLLHVRPPSPVIIAIPANEAMSFHFYTTNPSTASSPCKPLFTHQIFEKEMIFVEKSNIRIDIYVHTRSLRIFVGIANTTINSRDYKHITELLRPHFIANNTVYGDEQALQILISENSPPAALPPIGTILNTTALDNNQQLVLRLASNATPGAGELLKVAETLSLWYIETADSIDFTDNRFELVTAYSSADDLSGYMTLFTFMNPFAGNKLRICQILVLPHLQGLGIGRELVLAAYRLAAARSDIVEVTVEDPSEGFSRLRDAVDCEWLCLSQAWTPDLLDARDDVKTALARRLKITQSQLVFALEALQFIRISRSSEDDEEVDVFKEFRLKVKKQLLKENAEIKAAPKEQMQRYLEELYADRTQRYLRVEKNRHVQISCAFAISL